jgi:UDP-N-acetylmuramoyl-L-alanyl-D-glutamate--2,6-diaminopimelate ligase
MLLHTLLRGLDPTLDLDGVPNCAISSVNEDSRKVSPGCLFVARPGSKSDGARFAADAAARGAVAVLTQQRIPDCVLPQVLVADAAASGSVLANLFHDQPSHKIKILGITGTNGKTTTTYLLRHILAKAKHKRSTTARPAARPT